MMPPTSSRSDLYRHAYAPCDVPGPLLRWGRYFADQAAAWLGFGLTPDIRYLRRSAPVPGIYFHDRPAEIWIRETDDLAELADVVCHEVRHARALHDDLADGSYGTKLQREHAEAEAQRFGAMARRRVEAGEIPVIDPTWPKPPPLPVVERRSSAPPVPAPRQASPPHGPVIRTRHDGRRHVFPWEGGLAVLCRGCERAVPINTRHSCRGRRRSDDD